MKKLIIVPTAIILLAILAIYIFVPGKISLLQTIHIKCTAGAANRYLVNDSNWVKWWPSNASLPAANAPNRPNYFSFNRATFQPHQKMFNAIGVRIINDDLDISGTIYLVPKNKDSVYIQWNAECNSGNNPFTRIKRNVQARTLNRQMGDILATLKQFLEKDENVYGITIKKTIVKDTLLLATRKVFVSYPTTRDIYSLINKLKEHIQQQGAQETGYPMLNIMKKNGSGFETMVATPINKEVNEQNGIVIKKMVPGNILVAEVSGGVHTASHALEQMEYYLADHHYESPAIPFYSLITDRTAEPDTTKWVTRISYPVF